MSRIDKTMDDEMSTARQIKLVELGLLLKQRGYHFITPTPLTHARYWDKHRRARSLRDIFGWSLPFERDLIDDETFRLMEQAGVLEPYAASWRSRVRFSSLGELLLVHSAYPTDGVEDVFFGPDTYRFARFISDFLGRGVQAQRALDVGTGSGAGALVIAGMNSDTEVIASDINPQALAFCRVNTALAGARNIHPCEASLIAGTEGNYDLIVSNPPYMMDPLERSYRHGGKAFGAELSLQVVAEALTRLNPGGTLLLYTGVAIVDGIDGFRLRLSESLRDHPCEWDYEEIDPDVFSEELSTAAYAAVERIAVVGLRLTWQPIG